MALATTKEDAHRVVGDQRSTGAAGGEELRLLSPEECRRAADNGIAVEAQGRALKVHAGDTPHLVSLGSDRFSTAVTLHPIPKGIVFFFWSCIFLASLHHLAFFLCRLVAASVFVCVCVCPSVYGAFFFPTVL